MSYRRMAAASQPNTDFRELASDSSHGKATGWQRAWQEEISAVTQMREHGEILRPSTGKPLLCGIELNTCYEQEGNAKCTDSNLGGGSLYLAMHDAAR